MGWKNVKEHYRIQHIVHMRRGCVCIGSPYISELIVINPDGTFAKRDDGRNNQELARYLREMDADPAQLARLIAAPDTFTASVTVYTYDAATIIQKRCETPGWPNATHDGDLMYENTFSPDKAQVVEIAKRNAEAGVKAWTRNLKDAIDRVDQCEKELAQSVGEVTKLNADYPA